MRASPKKKPVNIKTVASLAGVSAMTVSRVLNKPEAVAPATRLRVLVAIDELGYTPNAIARSLKSQRSYILGMITMDLTDPFFTYVSQGAEAEARRYGYYLMVFSAQRHQEHAVDFVRLLNSQQVEGIFIIRDDIILTPDPLVDLPKVDIPIVTTGYHLVHSELAIIDIDNIYGGKVATIHLIEHGHQRIAMITGPCNSKAARDRSEGYYQAMVEYGFPINDQYICEGNWLAEGAWQAMRILLSRNLGFTALFVQSDAMAYGAARAIREAGLRVPEDISLVGYDDLLMSAYFDPPLTTIRQPTKEIGALAIQKLIAKLEGQSISEQGTLLKPTLILRQSVRQLDHTT